MSSHLIKNPELCNILQQYFEKHKLKASSIKIEITERDGINDDEKTLEMLIRAKDIHLFFIRIPVTAYPPENGCAVIQCMCENTNLCLLVWHKLTSLRGEVRRSQMNEWA